MTEDFSNHPLSIGEIKADRESDMRLWSPRDVLIDLLRRIDSGETTGIDALVVCYRRYENEEMFTSFGMACADMHTAIGLLSRVAYQINKD